MNEYLKQYKIELGTLSVNEQKLRDLYLRRLALGELQGPPTGYASIDKPWLKYYREEAIESDIPKMSAYSYLYECNKECLSNISLSYYGKKVTFKQLFDNIEQVSKSLKSMGIKKEDIVTVSMPNTPEAVYLFYAISKIGAIANMIDPRTSSEGMKKYIEEVDSKVVFIIDSYSDKIEQLSQDNKMQIITISPAESLPIILKTIYKTKEIVTLNKDMNKKNKMKKNLVNWQKFMEKGNEYRLTTEERYVPNRPVVIEHTGGTTGLPKGVVLTNENINSVALQSVLTDIDMKREHNWLDIMPTFIAYGVGMGLHLPLTIGMETILIPQFDPKKFDELLLKYKPIHMVGVPSYWGTIIQSKKLLKKDLSYIIAPTVGGDAMDKTLEVESNKYLKEHNCNSKIVKGYGMTEVTGGVAGTVDKNNEIGSVGIPFVKTTISIFEHECENELGYNEIGEICISGPNTMLGYFKNETATNAILKKHSDGKVWVHTGDVGYMNENGSIFIVDRIKRVIIRYDGFKVFPSIIEDVISSHKAVESCKVVSISDTDHRQGCLPKAHIVLKEDYKTKEKQILKELTEICYKELPEYYQPVDYKFRNQLPLTNIGKIDYMALEKEDSFLNNNYAKKLKK